MHPHTMLTEMVSGHRRDLIVEVAAFRRAAECPSRPIRSLAAVRRVAGQLLVRFGQALAGAPTSGPVPAPAGRQI